MEHSVCVLNPALLSDAVVCWTGRDRKPWPSRDDDAVVERFGQDIALDLLPAIKSLKGDFYASDARHRARTLAEMGEQAAADFRLLHPEIAEDAVQALTWCYTFDFK